MDDRPEVLPSSSSAGPSQVMVPPRQRRNLLPIEIGHVAEKQTEAVGSYTLETSGQSKDLSLIAATWQFCSSS